MPQKRSFHPWVRYQNAVAALPQPILAHLRRLLQIRVPLQYLRAKKARRRHPEPPENLLHRPPARLPDVNFMEDKQIAVTILNRRNSLSPIVMQGEMRSTLGSDGYDRALANRWIVPNYESGELQVTNNLGVIDQMRKMAESVQEDTGDPDVGDAVVTADAGDTYMATVASKNRDGTYELSFGDKKPRLIRPFKKEQLKVTQKATPTATTSGAPARVGTTSPTSPGFPKTPQGGRTFAS